MRTSRVQPLVGTSDDRARARHPPSRPCSPALCGGYSSWGSGNACWLRSSNKELSSFGAGNSSFTGFEFVKGNDEHVPLCIDSLTTHLLSHRHHASTHLSPPSPLPSTLHQPRCAPFPPPPFFCMPPLVLDALVPALSGPGPPFAGNLRLSQ